MEKRANKCTTSESKAGDVYLDRTTAVVHTGMLELTRFLAEKLHLYDQLDLNMFTDHEVHILVGYKFVNR